jgi:hypothetical protein
MNEHNDFFIIPQNIEHYLVTLSKLYATEGKVKLQELLVNSSARVHEGWSFDNWNGGTHGHAVFLTVPEAIYIDRVRKKNIIQDTLREDLNKVHNCQYEFIAGVFLEMEVKDDYDWRKNSGLLISPQRIVSQKIIDGIWDQDCFRLFATHKTEVKKETAKLKEQLRKYGISCFVAHEDIQPTKEWQGEIENALATMDAFVALMTENFHDSLWVDQEVGFAFGRGVPIIAVKLGRDPYGFIGKFQALSCNWDEVAKEITKIIIKHKNMINPYIKTIKVAGDYDQSNNLSELLPLIDNLTEQQAIDLVKAFNENGQVRDSYGFSGEKPNSYGYGLVHHLTRLTGKKYERLENGLIRI